MPPKKTATKARQTSAEHSDSKQDTKATRQTTNTSSKKRKSTADGADGRPSKAQRRSGRGGSAKLSQEQLLNFLLSKESLDLTRPDDEVEDLKKRGDIKTYSATVMNPFEELMCAIILSRPISHRLGLRTIRTVLNVPYDFTSAKAVQDAGSEKQHQALWDARTQHKDKTAREIGQLADVVLKKFTNKGDAKGTELGAALEQSQGDLTKLRELLRSSINGLGPTGLDIFFRRVQWLWSQIYPFIDSRTADSLRKFNLPYDPVKLKKLMEDSWKSLDTKYIAGSDDAQKRRRAFVVILERVEGASLEGKVELVISHAG